MSAIRLEAIATKAITIRLEVKASRAFRGCWAGEVLSCDSQARSVCTRHSQVDMHPELNHKDLLTV